MVDRLADESRAAIAQQELRTSRVSRLEADLRGPVAGPMTRIGRAVIASVVIDRNQRRAIAVAVIRYGPTVAGMFRTGRTDFAKVNSIGQAVFYFLQSHRDDNSRKR